jgi:transposase/anti-anti-sigma regulatory factor
MTNGAMVMPNSKNMLIENNNSPDGLNCNLALLGNLNIQDTEKVIRDFRNSISKNIKLRIDLNHLLSIDTSIFQVFLAATKSAKLYNCELTVSGFESSPIPNLLTSLGLDITDFNQEWISFTSDVPSNQKNSLPKLENTVDPYSIPSEGLFWLTEEQMDVIKTYIPKTTGRKRSDDLRILSGIIHVKKFGISWREAPSAYGSHKTLYSRWRRWFESGLFTKIIDGLRVDFPDELNLIEAIEQLNQ